MSAQARLPHAHTNTKVQKSNTIQPKFHLMLNNNKKETNNNKNKAINSKI